MRRRHVVLALTAVCACVVLLFWQRRIHAKNAAAVAPYTAHLTITKSRVLPDGSSATAISTVVLARDRQGRIYEKTDHGSFVQDPARLQTLTWDSHNQVAILGHWPYWLGRKGCWADGQGKQWGHFPSDEDWHKVPSSPREGKLETIGSISDPSGKRIKTRFVSENLGHKDIHGLNAYGMRWTMTPLESGPSSMPETTTELWKSSELDLKLLEVTSDPQYGLRREELSDLQRGDPDPTLFEPPRGYKVEIVEYHQAPCQEQ